MQVVYLQPRFVKLTQTNGNSVLIAVQLIYSVGAYEYLGVTETVVISKTGRTVVKQTVEEVEALLARETLRIHN